MQSCVEAWLFFFVGQWGTEELGHWEIGTLGQRGNTRFEPHRNIGHIVNEVRVKSFLNFCDI